MIDLDELLAPLADGTLGDPLPTEEIRRRAERRTRAGRVRRLTFVGAAAAVVLVVGVAAVLVSVDRRVTVETTPAIDLLPRIDTLPPVNPQPVADPATPLPVGNFPYDMASSGADLWVLNKFGNDVTRISTESHEVRSTIALPDGPPGAQPNRLAVTDDAVWVAGASTTESTGGIARIDRATEEVTFVPLDIVTMSIAVTVDGVWAAGTPVARPGQAPSFQWAIHRIDAATGAILQTVTSSSGAYPVDVAVTDDGVWVLLQANKRRGGLVHIDPRTGALSDETPVEGDGVRLVATDDELVIGTDTSGLGGRSGAVTLVDPTTGDVIASTPIDVRPEAIVLVDDLIITSGLRALDRRTLVERALPSQPSQLGFALARSGDDLWATDRGDDPDSSVVRRIPLALVRAAIADSSSTALGSAAPPTTGPPIESPPGWSLLSEAVLRPVEDDEPPPSPAWLRTGSDMTEMFTGPSGSVPVYDAPDGAVVGYLFGFGYISKGVVESPDFDLNAILIDYGMCPMPVTSECIDAQLEQETEKLAERESGGS